jgi:hypothetical protein
MVVQGPETLFNYIISDVDDLHESEEVSLEQRSGRLERWGLLFPTRAA